MAEFTVDEWRRTFELLDAKSDYYGLPERRPDSVVFASFNIRKFGRIESRSKGSWEFLRRFCERCDLIAIQEVMDNLSAVQFLKGLLGDNYGLVVSDATGGVPGLDSPRERLAYIFHWPTVKRTQVASDIAFERSFIFDELYERRNDVMAVFEQHAAAMKEYEKKMKDFRAGKRGRPGKPPMVLPFFLSFIRSPHLVGFEIPGFGDANPYRFVCVNAHLLYGDKSKQKEEREFEFRALLRWMIVRAKERNRGYHEDLLLFGDLNLDFERDEERRKEIDALIKSINETELKRRDQADVNFPFLSMHPGEEELFRTNARKNQTYDQIGFFAHDPRLPRPDHNAVAGLDVGGYDYGMFDFVKLFVHASYGEDKRFKMLNKSQQKEILKKFEYDVSDHMPIWVRLPKPYVGQPEIERP